MHWPLQSASGERRLTAREEGRPVERCVLFMVVLLLGASHVSDGIRRLALERHESFNMSIPGSGALVLQILFSVPDILDDAVNFAGLETLGDVWLASERLTEHLLLPTGQHESLYNSAYATEACAHLLQPSLVIVTAIIIASPWLL